MLLWIDAFESLALFGIVVVLFYSVATEPKFKQKRLKNSWIVVEDATASSGTDTDAAGADDASLVQPSSSTPPPAAFADLSTKVPISPSFTKCFIYYGLFVGVLALLDFLADVLRFLNWRVFGTMSMAMNVLLGVIFLPIWLLCLGRQLPKATERFERAEGRVQVLLDGRESDMAGFISKGSGHSVT